MRANGEERRRNGASLVNLRGEEGLFSLFFSLPTTKAVRPNNKALRMVCVCVCVSSGRH